MAVRAKFTVQKVTQVHWNPAARIVTLGPVYDTGIPEDQRFAKATPSGELTMQVDNHLHEDMSARPSLIQVVR